LRRLDWKVFARSDRLVVKEMVEETTLACHLLVDASESMGFGSLGWSKLDYARWCAASLAHLVISSRDTAGLVVFDKAERHKVPPGSGEPQKHAIWKALEESNPSGPTGVGEVLTWLGGRLRRRGIVTIFSDFFDDLDKVVEGLRRLVHDGHEPILFQVLDPLELTLSIDHLVRFDGLEASGVLKVDPKSLRAAYIEEIEKHNRQLAQHARSMSIDYVLLDTHLSLEAALTTYLAHRQVRAGSGGA
jgi:uncharacterized protein (DUF58 family)